jgi:hypothetical protein
MPATYDSDRPLGLLKDFPVTEPVLESLTRIERFEISAPQEGTLSQFFEKPSGSDLELKRFFALPLLFPDQREHSFVPSLRVDERWHRFILNTPHYRAFCEMVYGRYLDHVPGPTRHETGVEIRKGPMQVTIECLTRAFGKPNAKYWGDAGPCGPCLLVK